MKITDSVTLHNGIKMPQFGLGVYAAPEGKEVENAVLWALEAGYRSIDTAMIYRNEAGVGKAVRQFGIPRKELFITTKVWNKDQGFEKTLAAFDLSLEILGMDYIDLYLVHWPLKDKMEGTWKAMEAIYDSGRSRAIGVSNFLVHHLDDQLATARIVPMVNQFEFSPRLQQPELVDFCRQHKIQVEGWRPLMYGRVNDIPELVALGKKYGKTAAQVTLRWMLQIGIVIIPKSVKRERIFENANLYDFELTADEVALINGMDRFERCGEDPDNFNFD